MATLALRIAKLSGDRFCNECAGCKNTKVDTWCEKSTVAPEELGQFGGTMREEWIVHNHRAGLMMGQIVDVIGNNFAIRYRYANPSTTIKLKSITDITETEHFIFDTEAQCVAYGEHWEEQMRLARAC
jgi:hypothetical protein